MSRRARVVGAAVLVAVPGPAQSDPFPPRPEPLAITGRRACNAPGTPPAPALGIPARRYVTCSVVVDADPDASFTVGHEVNSQQARSRTWAVGRRGARRRPGSRR